MVDYFFRVKIKKLACLPESFFCGKMTIWRLDRWANG